MQSTPAAKTTQQINTPLSYEKMSLNSDSDYKIPTHWFPAITNATDKLPLGNLVLLSALGTPARHYILFAESLSKAGFNVLLVEQRGYGESAVRPTRHCDWNFKTILENEIKSSLDWIKSQSPSTETYLIGHSLGGQLSVVSTALFGDQLDGIILIACASPYYGNYQGKTRKQLRLLTVLTPILSKVIGNFPGHKLGFAGKEAKGLMKDWLQLAKYNRYQIAGIESDLNPKIASYKGKALSISFKDDYMAPIYAVRDMIKKLTDASITHKEITAEELSCKANHFDWLKQPEYVTQYVSHWLRG